MTVSFSRSCQLTDSSIRAEKVPTRKRGVRPQKSRRVCHHKNCRERSAFGLTLIFCTSFRTNVSPVELVEYTLNLEIGTLSTGGVGFDYRTPSPSGLTDSHMMYTMNLTAGMGREGREISTTRPSHRSLVDPFTIHGAYTAGPRR